MVTNIAAHFVDWEGAAGPEKHCVLQIRSRSSLETDSVQLVELPAYATFGTVPLLAEEQQLASAAEATAVLRLRRLLVA